jgi:hypothetical protein
VTYNAQLLSGRGGPQDASTKEAKPCVSGPQRMAGASLANAIGFLVLVWVISPRAAAGEGQLRLIPSLGLAEAHDDNLFSSPGPRESDAISRLSPDLRATYRATAATVLARFGVDAERYRRHRELDDARARTRAGIDLRYRPRRTWEVSFSGLDFTTNNAGELNTATGIAVGRVKAHRTTLVPTVLHRLTAAATASASYSFDETRGGGSGSARTEAFAVGLERRLGGRDTVEATYRIRRYAFDGQGAGDAHIPALRWSRHLAPRTRLRLEGGPRFYGGGLGAEVDARAEQRFHRGDASVQYVKTQATLFGQPVVVDVDAFTAALGYSPVRSLRFSAAPALYRSEGAGRRARVRRLEVAAAWRIARRLSLAASDEVSVQTGTLGAVAEGQIPRQVFTVRILLGEN